MVLWWGITDREWLWSIHKQSGQELSIYSATSTHISVCVSIHLCLAECLYILCLSLYLYFCIYMFICVHSYTVIYLCLCCIQLFATPWTAACQALLSMVFPRQGYRSGLPFPIPWDLPNPGIKPKSLASPALVGRFFFFLITAPPWEALYLNVHI